MHKILNKNLLPKLTFLLFAFAAYIIDWNKFAPVAQLDRALPSGGKGREFESRLVHHF
jgi:hypothetical protein